MERRHVTCANCRFCRYVVPFARFAIGTALPSLFWLWVFTKVAPAMFAAAPASNALDWFARVTLAALVAYGILRAVGILFSLADLIAVNTVLRGPHG